MQDFDSAIANYRQVLALKPEDARIRQTLARVDERRVAATVATPQPALVAGQPAKEDVAVVEQ